MTDHLGRSVCPTCRGNEVTDDGYPCPDCEPYDADELDCTHCGGDGECEANANPLWDCDDNPHPCHACGGSGRRRDQRIF